MLFVLGFVGLGLGFFALIKGNIKTLKIQNRKHASILLVVGLVLMIIGAPESEEVATEQPKQQATVETVPQDADEDSNKNEEEQEQVAAEPEEPSEPAVETYSSGMYIVGSDIEPGLYKSEGTVHYWARLSDFSGDLEDILANGNPQGSEIVEILDTDKGFESGGSGKWFRIDESYQPELLTEFGDGTYIVGKDIEPGTYRGEADGMFGYWARLKSFTGDLNAIIANGNPDGSVIIEIKSGDVGFTTSGSGIWKKID